MDRNDLSLTICIEIKKEFEEKWNVNINIDEDEFIEEYIIPYLEVEAEKHSEEQVLDSFNSNVNTFLHIAMLEDMEKVFL